MTKINNLYKISRLIVLLHILYFINEGNNLIWVLNDLMTIETFRKY